MSKRKRKKEKDSDASDSSGDSGTGNLVPIFQTELQHKVLFCLDNDWESEDEDASQAKMEKLLLDNLSSSDDDVPDSPQHPAKKKRLVHLI